MNVKRYQPEGFTERLLDVIRESGISKRELAREVGMSRSRFYDLLRADTTTNITTLARLCDVLNVSADYLLFGRKR